MDEQLNLFEKPPKQQKHGRKMDLGHRQKKSRQSEQAATQPETLVIPFPAKKRIGKARRVAEVIASKATQNAVDAYWTRIADDMSKQLLRAGVEEEKVEREIDAFQILVEQLLNAPQRGSDSA